MTILMVVVEAGERVGVNKIVMRQLWGTPICRESYFMQKSNFRDWLSDWVIEGKSNGNYR